MDREKVINGLEYCKHTDGVECPNCPYWHEDDCVEMLHADVIALLKEQDAVKPTWNRGKPFCGACGLRIRGGKFCSECGKPIAWEGR